MTRGGMYVWTACSAGWVVIGITTQLYNECFLLAATCAGAAYIWRRLG